MSLLQYVISFTYVMFSTIKGSFFIKSTDFSTDFINNSLNYPYPFDFMEKQTI